uniref:Putative secreted peptide n=1 Tax=Anopheles braziliensis TaxID=58242 RepID=A0A2M3ZV94_9DIPT
MKRRDTLFLTACLLLNISIIPIDRGSILYARGKGAGGFQMKIESNKHYNNFLCCFSNVLIHISRVISILFCVPAMLWGKKCI